MILKINKVFYQTKQRRSLKQKNMKLFYFSFLIMLLTLEVCSYLNPYKIINAHTALVTSVKISNDGTFFISGSQDYKVKVWSTSTWSTLHTQTYGDTVQNANIHPTDNRIFVTTWLSDISVLDPTTYTQLNPGGAGTYPNTGYGNSIIFKSDGSIFYMGGFDAALNPKIHKYDSTSYANLGSPITTTFPVNGQIVFMDIINDLYMVTVSNANVAPFLTEIWDLAGGTLIKSFSDSQDQVTSVHYHAANDIFFVSSKDNTIRSYARSVFNNLFQENSVEYTDSFGIPYAISTQYPGYLYAVIGLYVVQYKFDRRGRLTFSSSYSLPSDGFSIDIQSPYLMVGCNLGQVKVFKLPQSSNIQNSLSDLVIIGIVIGCMLFLIIVIIIAYKCCCDDQKETQKKNSQQKQQKDNAKSRRIAPIQKQNKQTQLVDITEDDIYPQGYR